MKHKKYNEKNEEILLSALFFFLSALTIIIGIAVLFLLGILQTKMKYVWLYIILLSVFSVALYTYLYSIHIRKRLKDANKICQLAKKIESGNYDINTDDLTGEYARIGENLKNVAKYLQTSEDAKTDFINDFSHELKTPIISIRGFAKIIAKGGLSEEEEKEYLSIIVSESDRLVDLTANTLMLSNLNSDRLLVEKKPFNLSEMTRKCILMLQEDWEAKNLSITADFDEIFINQNEELVNQMLLNVIQNAVKFSNENGEIEIFITKKDSTVTASVKDHGIGMDENTKKRMFDKYFRAEKSRTTPGNGLGLATVKKISELCGIHISVHSKLGEGTEFTMVFK